MIQFIKKTIAKMGQTPQEYKFRLLDKFLKEMEFNERTLSWGPFTRILKLKLETLWLDYCLKKGIRQYFDFINEIDALEIAFIMQELYKAKPIRSELERMIQIHKSGYQEFLTNIEIAEQMHEQQLYELE